MAGASSAGHGGSFGGGGGEGGDAMAAAAREEAEGVRCGICLTDARRAVRGELDCCGHHFCFVCIMAWARVESRCPFCKARFRTIRRPPVPGRFPSERLVAVAERNQACNPSGSTAGIDTNVTTSCSACNLSNDDDLLLLCELCDSAVHTYCAGLGTDIPEGDWFCMDCTTAKEEHSRCEIDDDNRSDHGEFKITIEVPIADPVAAPSGLDIVDEDYPPTLVQRTSVQSNRPSISDPVPSIYDIVDDDYTTVPIGRVNGRSTMLDTRAEHLPPLSISVGSQCRESPQEHENSQVSSHACSRLKPEKARTLPNSRNLSSRIRELRENWAALRAGSIGFATTHIHNNSTRGRCTGSISITEHQRYATDTTNSSQNGAGTCHQSSATFTEVAASSSGHANKISPKDRRDVRKAWKMLEIAQLSDGKKKTNKASTVSCSVPFLVGNSSTSYSPIDAILGQRNTKLYDGIAQKNNTDLNRSMENKPPTMNFVERHKLPEKFHASAHGRVPSTIMKQESLNGKVASSSSSEDADQIFETSYDISRSQKSKTVISCPLTFGSLSGQSLVTSSLQLRSEPRSQFTEMVSPQEPSAIATSIDVGTAGANIEVKSSVPYHHERKRKLGFETHDDHGSKRSNRSSTRDPGYKKRKSDISYLAIRELKLLNIDKTYGSDSFKEVARAATHTVLASCGLDHSPSVALALPRPVCEHICGIEPLQSPALMNFCRKCLGNFVKEVISSLLSARKMDQTAS
uniref:RING-type domain-containing protein n=1 Tax=Leersia perrieri TaxID=77586 RepID=A0A0D9WP98_9ORYZ